MSALTIGFRNKMGKIGKRKQSEVNRQPIAKIFSRKVKYFIEYPSHTSLNELIQVLDKTIKCKYHKRSGLAQDLIKCVRQADLSNCTTREAMVAHKNAVRRKGRKVQGKCIGTTLLTKGLEFDTVVILDAHRINSPKHFYVAVSRCCKQLVIFADGNKFSPYRRP